MNYENKILPSYLIEPLFGTSRDGSSPYVPTLGEVIVEWLDAINFIKYPTRCLAALSLLFHGMTFILLIVYFAKFISKPSLIFMIASIYFLGNIYNTVWYHRYCSHAAYSFKRAWCPQFFLWTNPFFFREESYAIPHFIHHQRTEKPGDPYGPHLGWLGSYLASESQQKMNTNITRDQYDLLKAKVKHIGIILNSYPEFKRTGSVEKVAFFILRSIFAQVLYVLVFYALGGIPFVLAWYAAVFIIFFLIRDFNWRGHGGNFRKKKKAGWEFDTNSYALNQHFYGYLASEWHDNHHRYPASANNGFLPGQTDVAFAFIKLLH
ncbi:MAG: fatty acid desaturase [Candidatus Omnitrophica bacterium]|nr:fatty acid desaturase [Candidatus Omnitrophota bacterium]